MQQEHYQQNARQYQYNFTHREMRRYFYKPSLVYIWFLIFGVFLLVIGMIGIQANIRSQGASLIVLGLIFLLGGGILFLIHYSCPTDDQYAKWVSERSQPLYNKALQRLHLDESQCESIIEVQGGISSLLQLTKKFPEKEIIVKWLPNGYRHYSINVCTYIFLTKDDLAIYLGYINALAQNERFEDADHYDYKDIVGVSTSGPIYISRDGSAEKETQMQGFLVRISSGETIGTDYATRGSITRWRK